MKHNLTVVVVDQEAAADRFYTPDFDDTRSVDGDGGVVAALKWITEMGGTLVTAQPNLWKPAMVYSDKISDEADSDSMMATGGAGGWVKEWYLFWTQPKDV